MRRKANQGRKANTGTYAIRRDTTHAPALAYHGARARGRPRAQTSEDTQPPGGITFMVITFMVIGHIRRREKWAPPKFYVSTEFFWH